MPPCQGLRRRVPRGRPIWTCSAFCFKHKAAESKQLNFPRTFALSASKGEVWELLGTFKIRKPLLDLEPFVEMPSRTWLFDSLQLWHGKFTLQLSPNFQNSPEPLRRTLISNHVKPFRILPSNWCETLKLNLFKSLPEGRLGNRIQSLTEFEHFWKLVRRQPP